jgi:hypothetical protein
MKHLTEPELIEQYYGEDDFNAAQHLEWCRECAEAYAALQVDFAEFDSVAPPERTASYEEQVWTRIAPLLPAYPVKKRLTVARGLWLAFGSATACAVLIAAGFYAGRTREHQQPPRTAEVNVPSPPPARVIVLLSDHLDRSERLLVELKHARSDDPQTFPPLREEAGNLLRSNSKWRQEAEKSDDPDMVLVLSNLNDLLSQLANEQGGLNPAAIANLQKKMKANGLLLDVRVLRSRLPNQRTSPANLKGGAA